MIAPALPLLPAVRAVSGFPTGVVKAKKSRLGVVNPRKPRRVTLSSGDEDAPSANLIRKKVPKMRSSKETEGFPYGSNRICYIELFASGEIKQLATYHDKIEGYVHAQSGISKLFAVWPGQWRSDLFIIDDLEAFRIGQRLIRV